ncbi:MAG: glycosyltransferase family 4 protein [Bacteroidota bacterium]
MPPSAVVIGRFPPPLDGQALATRRLAELLAPHYAVERVNLSPGDGGHAESDVTLRASRIQHYLRLRRHVAERLRTAPAAPVLWASISPMPLGHWRDLVVLAPLFQPCQTVYGVVHWGNFDRLFRSPWTALTATWLVRRLEGFVFTDDALAARCAPWIPAHKRHAIPNTIDADLHCTDAEVAAKREAYSSARPFRLLFLSNMIVSKGYLDVLEAVRLLRDEGLAVHADFVGRWQDDADRQAFAGLVDQHELGAQVTHHGGVFDRDRVKRFYLQADAFVLPTYYPTEAHPVSIIEALNAGTPILTTHHASIPGMVRERHEALFVPKQAPAAIAEAVQQVAEPSTWHRLAVGARARYLQRFSASAIQRRWLDLLERPRVTGPLLASHRLPFHRAPVRS